jgi:hypothetical protein
MGVWKDFCRALEHREVIRILGDQTSVIDNFALFEISNEQFNVAIQHPPTRLDESDSLMPPFPFPKICLLGKSFASAIDVPEMSLDTGELTFKILTYQITANFRALVIDATIRMDTTKTTGDGRLVYSVENTIDLVEEGGSWRSTLREDAVAGERAGGCFDRFEKLDAPTEMNSDTYLKVKEAIEKLDRVNKEHEEVSNEYKRVIRETTERIVEDLIRCISWINQPDLYVVRVEPPVEPKKKRKPQAKKMRRYSEREHFILLDKTQLTEAWHRTHQGGTHASPLPHLRRGHYKTLRAEKWKENRGKIIWVRATHVGGEVVEWRQGNTVYRVV